MSTAKILAILIAVYVLAVACLARADEVDAASDAYKDCVVNFKHNTSAQVASTATSSADLQSDIRNLTAMSIAACGNERQAVKDAVVQDGEDEQFADQKLQSLDKLCSALIATKIGSNIVKYQP